MKKRILQLTLLICVLSALFIALSVTASAASSGTCGDNLTWTLDDVGVLTISGEGTMYDYQKGDAPWYSERIKIVSVKIESNVTSIGMYAFYGCSSLTSITIPDSVTSIGSDAFYGCSSLTSITIPDSVTDIDSYAFAYCSGLTSIEIPDCVTNIGFCTFYRCSGLTSVDIPYGVTEIEQFAFEDCSSLTSITIPDSVTNIRSYAFQGCSGLKSITLPFVGGSQSSNTYIGYIFGAGSHNENSRYVPSSLEKVKITSAESITDYAFYGCSGIKCIEIPGGVTSIGKNVCGGCSNLESIIVEETNEIYLSDSNGVVFSKDKTKIIIYPEGKPETNYIIPDSVTSIGSDAFYGCSSLTSITIPDGVTSIGSDAFYGCSSLTSITIPDSVTNIGSSAFQGCSGLKSITLPFVGRSQSSNTYIGDIFGARSYDKNSSYVPRGLEKVKITSEELIADYAFYGCTGITCIEIPNSVTSIGKEVFAGCTSLQEIRLPFVGASREESGTGSALFGYVFGNMSGVEIKQYYSSSNYSTYKIPPSVKKVTITDAEIIPYGAFYNCYNIDTIVLNSGVDAIYSKAFYNCNSLVDITIPSEKLKMASTNVFSGCDMLTIHCIEGSDVEEYAVKYSIDFEPMDAVETTLTTSAEIIGGNIVVTAKANGSTTDKFIPVAIYNNDNKMLDLMIIPSNEDFEVVKIVFKDVSEASYVKLFIWDSYSDLTPLDTADKVEIHR